MDNRGVLEIMSNRKVVYLSSVLLFLIVVSIYLFYKYNPLIVEMDIKKDGMEMVQNAEANLLVNYDPNLIDDEMREEAKTPYEVVLFMISSVISGNPVLFSTTFEAEQLTKDLGKLQAIENFEGDEFQLVGILLNKISRNGKLISVNHIHTDENFFTGSADVKIELVYSDENPVTITLNLTHLEIGDTKQSFYAINTSALDIAEAVNSN